MIQDTAASTPNSDEVQHPLVTPQRRAQIVVSLLSIICFMIFWAAGASFSIPNFPGYEASLFQQSSPVQAMIIVVVLLAGCTAVCTLVGGYISSHAGLFAAAMGLSALSIRGGPMRYVLFHAQAAEGSASVFLMLGFEAMVLCIPVGAIWLTLWWMQHRSEEHQGESSDLHFRVPAVYRVLALLVQVWVMAVCVLVLARTDDKQQVLIGVGLAALAGTATAEYFFGEARLGGWYWVGPFAVALLGYVLAYNMPSGWSTGRLDSALAALARPLPLDYASFGTAGAILGYWMGTNRAIGRISLRPVPAK